MRVVATAGHVDHGKSTLVMALSGTDPDRLPEEKRRGLTIDLGFAVAVLPGGEEIAFVDVPGHERLVGNMLAGAGSVDACLFVVAATEGWKQQSEEHLRILELLGVRSGVVALTKIGLVEAGWADLVEEEIRERVAGSFLQEATLVRVDAVAGVGVGVEELRRALGRLARSTPAAPDRGRPRLWVDRCFTVAGAGTVVTGTLRDGPLEPGMELTATPGGHALRVRGMESHHQPLSHAGPGRRLAVNLVGSGRASIGRGCALVRADQWHLTSRFDAELEVLPALRHPVGGRGAFTVHLGSGTYPVRLRCLGPSAVPPGGRGPARMWLREGTLLPLLPGDRFVLREAGRLETVGGGQVLDVAPVTKVSRARPDRSVDRVVAERGWVTADELERMTGERRAATVGNWVVDPSALSSCREQLAQAVSAAGAAGIAVASLDERQRAVLDQLPRVVVTGTTVRSDRFASSGLSPEATRVLAELERGGCAPPTLPLSDRRALRELQRAGLAVEAGETWFASSAVQGAVRTLTTLLVDRPDGFTVAEARDVLHSSRRHVVPLLGYLDATAVTRRRGDRRTAGPAGADPGRGALGEGGTAR